MQSQVSIYYRQLVIETHPCMQILRKVKEKTTFLLSRTSKKPISVSIKNTTHHILRKQLKLLKVQTLRPHRAKPPDFFYIESEKKAKSLFYAGGTGSGQAGPGGYRSSHHRLLDPSSNTMFEASKISNFFQK